MFNLMTRIAERTPVLMESQPSCLALHLGLPHVAPFLLCKLYQVVSQSFRFEPLGSFAALRTLKELERMFPCFSMHVFVCRHFELLLRLQCVYVVKDCVLTLSAAKKALLAIAFWPLWGSEGCWRGFAWISARRASRFGGKVSTAFS